MQSKINKLLTIILISLLCINNVKAQLVEGSKVIVDSNTWTVIDKNNGNKRCTLESIYKPRNINVGYINTYDTIGYTYENVCMSMGSNTQTFITKEKTEHEMLEELFKTNQFNDFVKEAERAGNLDSLKTALKIEDGKFVDFNTTFAGIQKWGPNRGNYFGIPSITKTTFKNMKNFIDYYKQCVTNDYYDVYASCTYGVDKKGNCIDGVVSYCYNDTKITNKEGKEFKKDGKETSAQEWINYVKSNMNNSCAGQSYVASSDAPECINVTDGDEMWRSSYSVTTYYCSKVAPNKVEVYGNQLAVKIDNKNLEAYCINPSSGYQREYLWDYTFDASNCKNSLQSYNKDGSVSFDIDCGYAYILAEAKRLNAIKKSDYFSYGTIELAMRLFGTGETGNGINLGNFDEKVLLQSGGYYTTYYAWGDGEYVGIPNLRDNLTEKRKSENWPAIYQYFMPEFYSIYLRTAKVSNIYLKNNIRFEDVGNIKDSNGNYIIDPYNYLRPIKCNESCIECSQQSTTVGVGDTLTSTGIGVYDIEDSAGLNKLITTGDSKSVCTQSNSKNCKNGESGSYMGVLCGGADSASPNSEYIKAIYLYMRALQGNEIVYEDSIQNKTVQYVPIKGQTKYIYDVEEDKTVVTIRFAIENDSNRPNLIKDCQANHEDENIRKLCEAEIFVFDEKGEKIYYTSHYDECKKNYCYVKIKTEENDICKSNNTKLTSIVITDPDIKKTAIKKIESVTGKRSDQTLFVYDPQSLMNGGYCQQIESVKETYPLQCPCDPKKNPNKVESNGNFKNENYCDKNYNDYDELYYGDPSISTIINACYEEDKLKYDFTDDLNINGNDIVYDAELESKYSFQVKSDDFDVCKLYCRDETRFYIGNKLSVKAGQNLKYDIGQKLRDKKIINGTAGSEHNYMPSVVLQLRECTSEIDYKKWKSLYNNVQTTNDEQTKKQKYQLLYSIYNCNLYTTQEIRDKITAGKLPKEMLYENTETYESLNGFAEPAMIDYKYNTSDGTISINKEKFEPGTTKDYLLSQEGCTSLGLEKGTDCSSYALLDYDDDYFKTLGVKFDYEHGLVKSNLNETIYCSGEKCYKLKGNDGEYYYNPYNPKINDYTTQENIYDDNPTDIYDNIYDNDSTIIKYESGKILDYNEWGLEYQNYDKNSNEYKSEIVDGNEVPTNQYASFVVVTETGFYNNKKYYSQAYSGLISTEKTENNIELEKNILPLHLNKETATYKIKHKFNKIRTAYKRNSYYIDKNYPLIENFKNKSTEFKFICDYDVYNSTVKFNENDTTDKDNKQSKLGFTYRIVNLENVFESVTEDSRKYPENWNTPFGLSILNQIQSSSNNILEHEGDLDEIYSYLEYSYTLTPKGINRIREENDDSEEIKGYLDDTTYDCEYDPVEQIFFNCKSLFLQELEYKEGPFAGIVKVNKNDGISEFCSSMDNSDKDYCKYQLKGD